jgi:hypothetical protein
MPIHRGMTAIVVAACCILISTPAMAGTRTAMMQITVEVRPSCGASTRSDPGTAVAFTCGAQSISLPLRRGAVQEPAAMAVEPREKQNRSASAAAPKLMLTEF